MNYYVLGFAFDAARRDVLLIEKARPEWQAGRLNGVGGKVEPHDVNVWHAMAREFREETGLDTKPDVWRKFAVMSSNVWDIACFTTVGLDLEAARAPKGGEPVWRINVDAVRSGVNAQPLSNLPWLISLALDVGEIHGRPDAVHIRYASSLP